MVRCAINSCNVIQFLNYIDFIRSVRWKTYGWWKHIVTYGKYLDFPRETSSLHSIYSYDNAHNVDSMVTIRRRQPDASL